MTEAGRKWALSKVVCLTVDPVSVVDLPSSEEQVLSDAEFWIRAFCEDVVRLSEDPKYIHEPGRRGLAFDELKRKFLED